MIFLFSIIWSFGAALSDECRIIFDKFLREKMIEFNTTCHFPKFKTIYEYYIDFSDLKWVEWIDGKTNIDFASNQKLEEQLIPACESAAIMYLSRLLVEHNHSILLNGPSTSKILIAKTLSNIILDKNEFDCHYFSLSSCSKPNDISSFIMQHMHKYQGKFGPLPNQKLVFAIDNINSPKPEVYGAQPPLELLRQFFDYGGWYNTKNITFNLIVRTTIISTMSEAFSKSGSRFPARLLWHFVPIHIPGYSLESYQNIISQLLSQRMGNFSNQIKSEFMNVAKATLFVLNECITNLLPIPSKMHYIFSLRNIIHVIRGILLTSESFTKTKDDFFKLWYHEIQREIEDRLSTEDDRKWFNNILNKACQNHFGSDIIDNSQRIMFNTFSDESEKYKEVTKTPEEILKACTSLLEAHNNDSSKPISITLFQEAVFHLSSISRVFAMKRGHAMLVGVKSSGRKSLSRLALFISGFELFEISITRSYSFIDWREDMKTLLKQCTIENTETVFIISDVQIIMNQQLEDLSNLVSNGEIPLLFDRDEFEGIKAELAQQELIADAAGLSHVFLNRIQKNLHIILVASPYGTVFKDIMLYFPELRNEMTIDWYLPWSEDALMSIAYESFRKKPLSNLSSLNNSTENDQNIIESVVKACVRIHKYVENMSTKFFQETKRFTAVTPSKYFELIQTFKRKLELKENSTMKLVEKYENGVEKIKITRASITTMSKQLDIDIPVLQKTRGEVKLMLGKLHVKQDEVEENRAEVKAKSDIAAKEATAAKRANHIAQRELKKAEPILQEAQNAVNKLDKDSLVNIKKLHNPSAGMKDTFDAVCILFGKAPRKVDGSMPGEKIEDYWPEAVSLLNDIGFIRNVQNFKMDGISKDVINKLNKYVNKDVRAEKRKAALASFQAVAALYDWVCASYDYWHVLQEILPKKQKAEKTAQKLEETKAILSKAKEHLQEVENKLAELMSDVEAMQKKENELNQNVTNTQKRLERAKKILSGLEGETTRWVENANKLKDSAKFIIGNSLLLSGALTYLGAFSPSFRLKIIDEWKSILKDVSNSDVKNKIPIYFTENFTIENYIGNEALIRNWVLKGLPNDTHSVENALIIQENDTCFPLLIDPQLSGTRWLQSILGENLILLNFDAPDFLNILKKSVSLGNSVLIENVGLKLDPIIEPIVSREISLIDGQKKICLGGEYITYNDEFRLYISTKYPNPHYSPEVCSQLTLINFTTTHEGLSDLLINNLLEVEKADLEKMRINLMESKAENVKKLKDIEDEILQIVSNASGDILDDDTAIETLQKAQVTSSDIEQQMKEAEKTENEISEFKKVFFPVSDRAALLYFCVSDFSVIDPMYQFSLKWFVPLFRNSIQNADHSTDSSNELVENFQSSLANAFYDSVSFSLFSRHKLLFSTLMTVRILLHEKKINPSELAFLLSPNINNSKFVKNEYEWLSDDIWHLLVAMKSASPEMQEVFDSIKLNEEAWKNYYLSKHLFNSSKNINSVVKTNSSDSTSNLQLNEIPFTKFELSEFQKLLIIRVFHLEKVQEGLRAFISKELGEQFITPPTLNLVNIFKESDPLSPLIFIIMPGIDPLAEIVNVAQILDTEKYLKSYSLGRGRGKGAEELILDSAYKGFWVVLQNCHLCLSFMPRLEYLISHLDPKTIHKRFRLCLVTMSSPEFPIGILYQGTKLIYEIPKGIRENVTRLYALFNEEEYDQINPFTNEKKLTFNLALFHAVVLERLQFGSIGWNIPYEFNPSDFLISRKHLRSFIKEAFANVTASSSNFSRLIKKLPLEELIYVIGELDYGGRVTDPWDRRLLLSILTQFFSNKPFLNERRYPIPDTNAPLQDLLFTVSEWSHVTIGADVGLGENASTIIARNEAIRIFDSLVEVQPTLVAASESISEDQYALNLIKSLKDQIPRQFNPRTLKLRKFKSNLSSFKSVKSLPGVDTLENAMNTVLEHEILLFNDLISIISESLDQMEKGLQGLVLIDESLETLLRSLLANKIPALWLSHSFPSILNLSSYMTDLNKRVDFLQGWLSKELSPPEKNEPDFIFLGGFYHPEEFLTAILQEYARKNTVPFDTLRWTTTLLTKKEAMGKILDEGVYIEGLKLEGAIYDVNQNKLIECGEKDLNSDLPIIKLVPTQEKSPYDMTKFYECPVFRTQNRGTGALDLPNYIMSLYLPTPDVKPDHWVQRSVAAFITIQ